MIKFIIKTIKKIVNLILVVLAIVLGITFAFTSIYPLGYREEIVKYSKIQDVDPFLVSAIIRTESNFYKDAVSNKKAKGLMQITPTTGEWISEQLNDVNYYEDKLFLPEINIQYGTWYLNKLGSNYEDLNVVLSCYNAGSGNVSSWLSNSEYSKDGKSLEKVPFKETEEYIEKVNRNKKIYKLLYKDIMYREDKFTKYYFDIIIKIRNLIKSIKL